ncbi:MAG: Plug domain-containing protein, partial [Bacteroidota bacterium]
MRRHFFILLAMIGAFGLRLGFSQVDSLALEHDSVLVQAAKIAKPWLESATSSYVIQPVQREQVAQNSLQEFLLPAPSVFSLNANNRAQDLRISIRGFGSRAAFGVRGVKIIVDGIPETTTDGQGQLDNLNLGILQQIEVLNNGSAALYGNASGGVLNLRTLDESAFREQNH